MSEIETSANTNFIRGYKVRLKPNKTQTEQLVKSSDASRFVYNWALNIQMDNFKQGLKFIQDGDLRKQLTQLKKTDADFKWLYEVSNNVSKQAVKDLCSAYKRFFDTQQNAKTKGYSQKKIQRFARLKKELTSYDLNGHPKFKSKGKVTPSFYNDPLCLLIKDKKVLIEKIGWINLSEPLPERSSQNDRSVRYFNPRLTCDSKYWYLSLSIEQQTIPDVENMDTGLFIQDNKQGKERAESIGIDLGIKDLAIVSTGVVYSNINKSKRLKKLNKGLKRLQRQVSRKYQMNKTLKLPTVIDTSDLLLTSDNTTNTSDTDKKKYKENKAKVSHNTGIVRQKGEVSEKYDYNKTKNILKLEKKIKLKHKKIKDIRDNYTHQVTTQIAKTNPKRIMMEDLNISGLMKNRHLSKAIQSQSWHKFIECMKYKSKRHEVEFVQIPRYYPSSKLCSLCGSKKINLKLKDRIYKCDNEGCLYNREPIDRDLNASYNIRDYKAIKT